MDIRSTNEITSVLLTDLILFRMGCRNSKEEVVSPKAKTQQPETQSQTKRQSDSKTKGTFLKFTRIIQWKNVIHRKETLRRVAIQREYSAKLKIQRRFRFVGVVCDL